MEYTQLGRTGLTVSRAGFGGGGIGQVWGATDEAEAIASVHRALDLGITFFDVAPSYGDGKAEEALGKALEGRTEPVVVCHQGPPSRRRDGRHRRGGATLRGDQPAPAAAGLG